MAVTMANMTDVSINVMMEIQVTGAYNGIQIPVITILYDCFLIDTGVPALLRSSSSWYGTLTTLSSGEYVAVDDSVFDHVPPVVIKMSNGSAGNYLDNASAIVKYSANPQLRSRARTSVHGIGAGYLHTSSLSLGSNVIVGVLSDGGNLEEGALVFPTTECDLGSCPKVLVSAVKSMAPVGCNDPIIISLQSRLSASVFVTASHFTARSMTAVTHANVVCGKSDGYVSITLSTYADPPGPGSILLPLENVLNDSTVMSSVISSIGVQSHGYIDCHIVSNDVVKSCVRHDIYDSYHPVGISIPDRAIDAGYAQCAIGIISEMNDHLRTSSDDVNKVITDDMPSPSTITSLLMSYMSSNPYPTVVGFWSFLNIPVITSVIPALDGSVHVHVLVEFNDIPWSYNTHDGSVTAMKPALIKIYDSGIFGGTPVSVTENSKFKLLMTGSVSGNFLVSSSNCDVMSVSQPIITWSVFGQVSPGFAIPCPSILDADLVYHSDIDQARVTRARSGCSDPFGDFQTVDFFDDEPFNNVAGSNVEALAPIITGGVTDLIQRFSSGEALQLYQLSPSSTKTYSDVGLLVASTIIKFNGIEHPLEIVDAIEDAVISMMITEGAVSPIISVGISLSGAPKLLFQVESYSHRDIVISSDGQQWYHTVHTDVVSVPMMIRTTFRFSVSLDGFRSDAMRLNGRSERHGVMPPVTLECMPATLSSSSIVLEYSLPDSSSKLMHLDGQMHDGRLFSGCVGSRSHGTVIEFVDDISYGDGTVSSIDPLTVFSSVSSLLQMGRGSGALLNKPMAPFVDSMNTITDNERAIEDDLNRIMTIISTDVLCETAVLSAGGGGSRMYNITINSMTAVQCQISYGVYSDIQHLRLDVERSIQRCNLSSWISVVDHGQILRMISRYHGVIVNWAISCGYDDCLFAPSVWSASPRLDLFTLQDIAVSASSALTNMSKITMVNKEISTDFMDIDIYNKNILPYLANTTVTYGLGFDLELEFDTMLTLGRKMSGSGVNVTLEDVVPAVTSMLMNTTLLFVPNCPIGERQLILSTCFNDTAGFTIDDAHVPDCPNCIITVAIEYEERSLGGSSVVKDMTQDIELQPGSLVSDCLMRLPSMMQYPLSGMLNVSRDSTSWLTRYKSQRSQLEMIAQPYVDSVNYKLYLPLSYSVTTSVTSVVCSAKHGYMDTNAVRSCAVLEGFNMNNSITVKHTDSRIKVFGTDGIVPFMATGYDVQLQQNVSVVNTTDVISLISAKAAIQNDTEVVHLVNATGHMHANISLFDLKLQIDDSDLPTTGASLELVNHQDGLIDTLSIDAKFNASFHADSEVTWRGLNLLSRVNPGVTCDMMHQLSDSATEYCAHDLNVKSLPFVNKTVFGICKKHLLEPIERVMTSVCARRDIVDINTICRNLNDYSRFNMCTGSQYHDQKLILLINLNVSVVESNGELHVNLGQVLQSNLPDMNGAANSVSLLSQITLKTKLVIDVSGDSIVIYIGKQDTEFAMRISASALTRFSVYIGASSLQFNNVKINIDAIVIGRYVEGDNKMAVSVTGGANLCGMIRFQSFPECEISLSVPSIIDYFHGSVPIFKECNCGLSFLDTVVDLVDQYDLTKLLTIDPSAFIRQFGSSMDLLLSSLLDGVDGDVCMLQRSIKVGLTRVLSFLNSGSLVKHHLPAFTDLAREMRELEKYGGDKMNHYSRVLLTKLLNNILGPWLRHPIQTPSDDGDLRWHVELGRVDLDSMDSGGYKLGSHGLAEFDYLCQANLKFDWNMTLDIQYIPRVGITVTYPVNPVFSADLALDIPPNCIAAGRIGYAGADITLKAVLDGKIVLDHDSEHDNFVMREFKASVDVEGDVVIGLTTSIRHQIDQSGSDSMMSAPHFTSGISASWLYDINKGIINTTPFNFELTKPRMCLGTFLVRNMRRPFEEMLKPTQQIENFLDKLMQPVPGTFVIFGQDVSMLQVVSNLCRFSGRCNFRNLNELIEMLMKMHTYLERFEAILNAIGDDEGCLAIQYLIPSFRIDWLSDDISPIYLEPPPTDPVIFGENVPEHDRAMTYEMLDTLSKNGQFGFKILIGPNYAMTLIKMLLGIDIPLFQANFPSVSFVSSPRSVSFCVYPWPTVYLVFGWQYGMYINPPAIRMTSRGLIAAARSGDAKQLFNSVQIAGYNDDGNRWAIISAFGMFYGGVRVEFNFFGAEVSATVVLYIKVEVDLYLVNPSNEKWVPVNVIVHQFKRGGVVDVHCVVKLGLEFFLELCYDLKFERWCVTLVDIKMETVIADIPIISPKRVTRLGDGNNVNQEAVTETWALISDSTDQAPSIHLDTVNGQVAMTLGLVGAPVAGAPLSAVSCLSDVHFVGRYSGPYDVYIGTLETCVHAPNSDQVSLTIREDANGVAPQFQMNSMSLSVNYRPMIQFEPLCKSVQFIEPSVLAFYDISGTPGCPVELNTGTRARLSLSGAVDGYNGQITVNGNDVDSVMSTIPASYTEITRDDYIAVHDGHRAVVHMRGTVLRLQYVTHDTTDSISYIHSVPSHRHVDAVGAPCQRSNYYVTDIWQLAGSLRLNAHPSSANTLVTDVRLVPNSNHVILLTPVYTYAKVCDIGRMCNESAGYVVAFMHDNFNDKFYNIHQTSGSSYHLEMRPPIADEVTSIDIDSAPSSPSSSIVVNGCDGNSVIMLKFHGVGEHLVSVTNLGNLQSHHCVVQVLVDDNKDLIVTIEIDARNDTSSALRYTTVSSGSFLIQSLIDKGPSPLVIEHSNVQRMIVRFGPGDNEVIMSKATTSMEVVFQFPYISDGHNIVSVSETLNTYLINGSLNVLNIGPEVDPLITPNGFSPLSRVRGTIALNSAANAVNKTEVILDSGRFANSPGQSYLFDQDCLNSVDGETATPSSEWMCEQLEYNSIGCHRHCQFIYNDAGFNMTIETGGGRDSLNATHISVNTTFVSHGDRDNVSWTSVVNSNAVAFIDVGLGPDYVMVYDSSSAIIDLGDDRVEDIVVIYYDNVAPSVYGSGVITVVNSELHQGSRMFFHSVVSPDKIRIKTTPRSSASPSSNTDVYIEANVPGMDYYFDMSHYNIYHVTALAPFSTVEFASPTQPAIGATVSVEVSKLTNQANVVINGDYGADNVAGFYLTSANIPLIVDVNVFALFPERQGYLKAGNVTLQINVVDHVYVNTTVRGGVVNIHNHPSSADVLIEGAGDTVVNMFGMNNTVMIARAVVNVGYSVMSESNYTMICAIDSDCRCDTRTGIDGVSECLVSIPHRSVFPISRWIKNQAIALGSVVTEAANCSIMMTRARELHVTSSRYNISGLVGSMHVKRLMLKNERSISLDLERNTTKQQWSSLTMHPRLIVVHYVDGDNFTIMASTDDMKVSVFSPKMNIHSAVSLDCTNAENKHTTLNYHAGDVHTSFFSAAFSNGDCYGAISSVMSVDPETMPAVIFKGMSESSVTLRLNNMTRDVHIDVASDRFTAIDNNVSAISRASFKWRSCNLHDAHVTVHHHDNSTVYVSGLNRAKYHVTLDVADRSRMFLGIDRNIAHDLVFESTYLDLSATQLKYIIQDSDYDQCFDPIDQCSGTAAVSASVLGGTCFNAMKTDNCPSVSKTPAHVIAHGSLMCLDSGEYALVINGNSTDMNNVVHGDDSLSVIQHVVSAVVLIWIACVVFPIHNIWAHLKMFEPPPPHLSNCGCMNCTIKCGWNCVCSHCIKKHKASCGCLHCTMNCSAGCACEHCVNKHPKDCMCELCCPAGCSCEHCILKRSKERDTADAASRQSNILGNDTVRKLKDHMDTPVQFEWYLSIFMIQLLVLLSELHLAIGEQGCHKLGSNVCTMLLSIRRVMLYADFDCHNEGINAMDVAFVVAIVMCLMDVLCVTLAKTYGRVIKMLIAILCSISRVLLPFCTTYAMSAPMTLYLRVPIFIALFVVLLRHAHGGRLSYPQQPTKERVFTHEAVLHACQALHTLTPLLLLILLLSGVFDTSSSSVNVAVVAYAVACAITLSAMYTGAWLMFNVIGIPGNAKFRKVLYGVALLTFTMVVTLTMLMSSDLVSGVCYSYVIVTLFFTMFLLTLLLEYALFKPVKLSLGDVTSAVRQRISNMWHRCTGGYDAIN